MRFLKFVGASALVVGLAFPALAEVDVPNLTCGAYMALSVADRNDAAQAVMNWANKSSSDLEGCMIAEQVKDRTVAQTNQWIESHCDGKAADALLVEKLCELE